MYEYKTNCDIQLRSNRNFGLVAFLIDRKDFLGEIEYIRKRLKVKVPYILPNFPFNEVKNALEDFCLEKKINLHKLDRILDMASIQAEGLLRNYKKSRLYFPVMLALILAGYVHWTDFSSTHMLELDPKNDPNEIIKILYSNDKKIAILVNRESTSSEVPRTGLEPASLV